MDGCVLNIPKEEFGERIAKSKKMMEKSDIGYLIVTSIPDMTYLSNYTLYTGTASVLIPKENEPVLLIDQDWDLLRAKEISGISNTQATTNLTIGVPEILKNTYVDGKIGIVGWSTFPTPLYLAIKNKFPNAEFKDVTDILRTVRMIKSPAEILCLENAARITDEGAKTITEVLEVGKTELEIVLQAEATMKLAGARELSFPTVLGSGDRTELIVPQPTEKKIEMNDLILMDLGGRYNGYCADISRTKIVGNPTQEQKDLFEVVLQMHKEAIETVKPGVKAFEVHEVGKQVAQEAGYGEYVVHLIGHGVGLEEHEPPILETEETELVPGIVHSIEPGLYVPGVGGIRVEDTVLVTETGCKLLTSFDRGL
ncbi:MAG: M24 family metallopeptidase [Promethearchaeota archaeon]